MENVQPPVAISDWEVVHNGLENHYREYVRKQLIKYKTDTIDIDEIINVGYKITKRVDVLPLVFDSQVRDEKWNRFIHIAVNKKDVAMVEWLLKNDANHKGMTDEWFYRNKYGSNAFDLCMKHFSPEILSDPNIQSNARQIFDMFIQKITERCSHIIKRQCLAIIIAKQLKYKKCNINFIFNNALFESLKPDFSTMYKNAKDLDGNTFGHLLVEQENPDELYEWLKQERISFKKNSAGLTPLDLAAQRFNLLIQNIEEINTDTECFKKNSCCLYILLNYLKRKELKKEDTSDFTQCCDKHVL